jgi:hypothetical protein
MRARVLSAALFFSAIAISDSCAATLTTFISKENKTVAVLEGEISDGDSVVTPPDQIVWLTPDELRSMGVTMTGKPAQVSPEGQPMQLPIPPTTQAKANPSPTWKELVSSVARLSASQNNGTPRINRVCQPEFKVCTMAIFYKNKDGVDSMLRTAEDVDGNIFKREICEFNKFSDVRTCVDWERGTVQKDMRDAKGNWSSVSRESE